MRNIRDQVKQQSVPEARQRRDDRHGHTSAVVVAHTRDVSVSNRKLLLWDYQKLAWNA